MRRAILPLLLALSFAPAPVVHAQEQPAASAEVKPGKPASREAVLDTPAGVLRYTVTADTLPVFEEEGGKEIARIFHTSYIAEGDAAVRRPVTFLFNGGPGAASAYLHFGGIGPKRLAFGNQGDGPSDPIALTDSPESWLAFTDLVFVDPVGTGFSTAAGNRDEVARRFWGVEADVGALGAFVARWLNTQKRRDAPIFLTGESYGGFRVPRLARELQMRRGVGVRGMVLLSPVIDFAYLPSSAPASPLAAASLLPSMAATVRERQGRAGRSALADVEAYAGGDYLVDLMRGPGDRAATARLVERVAALTGLDAETLRRVDGRPDAGTFLRAESRDGRIGSLYDANVTAYALDAQRPDGRTIEPVLDASLAPLAATATHYLTVEIGYDPGPTAYRVLNGEVTRRWDWGRGRAAPRATGELRAAHALDQRMRTLVAHGATDLVTPYMASKFVLDSIEPMGDPGRLALAVYPGGHMFYTRADSRAAFLNDVRAMYQAALRD